MGKHIKRSKRVRNKKNVNIKDVDLSEVQFPKIKSRAYEMRSKIAFLVRQGYKKFMTTIIQVKDVDVSDSNPIPIDDWEYKGFFHDCTKLKVPTSNYDCIRLYARKE